MERDVDTDSVRRIHLRNAPPALVRDAAALCRAGDVEVLLGGDIALARELRAGVHLKAAQLAGLAQRPLPATLPVAASCHDADDLAHAERLRCDFAVLGPVKATPSHPGA